VIFKGTASTITCLESVREKFVCTKCFLKICF